MKLHQILNGLEYTVFGADDNPDIEDLSLELSECRESSLLIIPNSKKHPKLDGGNILPTILCDFDMEVPSYFPTVRVKDARRAMAFAYSNFYEIDYSRLHIIGVSGTNGKTSTSLFIYSILRFAGIKAGFIGTGRIESDGEVISENNYSMTTPDPDLLYKSIKKMQLAACTAVIMEVSSHALTLGKVDPIPFKYGIMTNLSSEHMDFHKNMENYFQAKCKLFSLCSTGVFNIDDDYARRAYNERRARKISVGAVRQGDVYATDVEDMGFDGISYVYRTANFSFRAKLKTAGIYNVYNSMLAAVVCIDMGILPCVVRSAMKSIRALPGRFEIIKERITVIIDYAHTEGAFESVLKSIRSSKSSVQSLTVIFGAGGERDGKKRPRFAEIAEKYADRIIVTSDNSRNEDTKDIIADIIRGFKEKSYEICEDRRRAIYDTVLNSEDGSVIAIIGKGAEKYNIDKDGYHPFDEKEIVYSALAIRRNGYEDKA